MTIGLIIITDRIDNLRKIATSEIDSDFNRFITDNSSKIAILSSDNIKDEWTELYKKPIVLMSTQRYFNLEIDSILQLTKNRNKIVFDEKPFILDFVKVDIKALNDIDTALKQGLNDTICQSDKGYIIKMTENTRKRKLNKKELLAKLKKESRFNIWLLGRWGYSVEIVPSDHSTNQELDWRTTTRLLS